MQQLEQQIAARDRILWHPNEKHDLALDPSTTR